MEESVYIEEALQDVLKETDLVNFERKLCVELQLSRLEHFDHVTDDELKSYTGLSQPAIRRLRVAIAEKKKKHKKSKGIFSSIGKKESREVTKVLVPATNTVDLLGSFPENGATCLIVKDEIKIMERLGEGSFAVVKRAVWTPKTGRKLDVAVKILRDSTPEIIEDLQREVTNMQKLQHPNLIQLYGIIFSNPAMMIVEFCDGGALIDRLRSTQKPVILVSMLVDYAQQIAKGMAYLESKNCVHRDLAARNVLLTNYERVVKICDFGLMRVLENNERLYVMSTQKKVPFAWCPPESLRFRQFSHASDVWSFGVTLWELFSYGEEPWVGLRGAEVLTKLEAGERLPKPRRCSDELYDFISTCWSLQANLRPKFSLLKGILSEIMFMVAECREVSPPSEDADLELTVNDLVIVIQGSGLIWYGQNVRTRKFGSFYRSSVHLRNERNKTRNGGQLINPLQQQSGISTYISKPVPGSFIHAGHGDINADQSWGQPDYIDDIYLKNPILRKEEPAYESGQKHFGPEIIPSLTDLKPPLYRWKQNQANTDNDQYIDPFAPFSVYSFGDVNYNESCQSNDGATKLLSSSLVSNFYDQPPSSTSYVKDTTHHPSSGNPLSNPSTSYLNVSNNISTGTTLVSGSAHSHSQLTEGINSANSANLRRAVFATDATTSVGIRQRIMQQSVSASNLPSTSWEHFQPSCDLPTKSDVQGGLNYQLSTTEEEYQNMIDKGKTLNGKIPPPRPKPPNFKQINQKNAQWGATSVVQNIVQSAYNYGDIAPKISQSSSVYSETLISDPSCTQDSLDPFEISKTVKDIATRGGYSQLFKDLPTSNKTVSVGSLTTTDQLGMKQLNTTNGLMRPSSVFLDSERTSNNSFPSPLSGLRKSPLDIGTCYYWQPNPAKHSVPQQPNLLSTYGSTPALLCESNWFVVLADLQKPTTNGVSLLSRYTNICHAVNSSKQRNSFLSDEILGMFDPLVTERVTSDARNVSASSVSNSDPVSTVLRNAAFADRRRCAIKLQRYNNNIEKAVNELKIEELLSMGVAQDRGQAISALEDCRWDLNAAAAALIS
uniref:non-specific protein-tyrosine kinase n=1 Tax=Setaria digitata TaxID=48799 RepID=A0A915PE56_9BILA